MLKKLTLPVYLLCGAAILALAGLIVGIMSNGIEGYDIANFGLTIAFSIISIVLAGGVAFSAIKFGNQHFISAAGRVAIIILLAIGLAFIITNRVEVVSMLSWDRDNQAIVNAWNTGLVSVILFVVADLVVIVSGFFGDKAKQEAPAQEAQAQ